MLVICHWTLITGCGYSGCGAGGGAPRKYLAAYAEAPAFAMLWRGGTSC